MCHNIGINSKSLGKKLNNGLAQKTGSTSLVVFIGLFGLIGGITLLRSYAAQNPTVTTTPGVYTLADFATDSPQTFRLGLSKSARYCLSPTVSRADQKVTIVSLETSYSLRPEHGNIECFSVDRDYPTVNVKLPLEIGQPTALTVSRK